MSLNDLYDKLARTYEDLVASPEVDSHLTQKVGEVFKKYNITTGTVLDLGCGPGNLKYDLLGQFEFTGVDPSPEMLKEAKKKGYQAIEGRMEDVLTTLATDSYDYVIAVGCLLFVKDIQMVLREMDRVARKAWAVSLDDITDSYAQSFVDGLHVPVYNHSHLEVVGATEDIRFDSWKSDGEQMVSRLIFHYAEGK